MRGGSDWKCRAAEIPGHVFAVLYDGSTAIDVETTNALGFNPSDETREKIKRADGKETTLERHHGQRREVGDLGLVAVIYYNHGVSLANDKRFREAALANASALALDPANPSAAKNLMADLNNWSLDLSGAGRYEPAVAVVAIGLKLDPKESSLVNNQRVIWNEYAASLMKAQRDDDALAVVARASRAIPGFDLAGQRARLFVQAGGEALQAGQFQRAADVLEAGLKAEPNDSGLANNVAYLTQEWAKSVEGKSGMAAAVDVLIALRRRFPKNEEVKQVAANQVRQFVQTQTQQARYDDALAAIERYNDLLGGHDEAASMAVYVYDTWAGKHMDSKDWPAAIGVYEQGLKKLPGNGHLTNNLAYCQQQRNK